MLKEKSVRYSQNWSCTRGLKEMAEATDVGAPGLAQFTEVWGNLCGSCLEKGNSLMRWKIIGLSAESGEYFVDGSSYNKCVVRLDNSETNFGAVGRRYLFSLKSKEILSLKQQVTGLRHKDFIWFSKSQRFPKSPR